MSDKYINEIYALAVAALRKGQPYFRVHIFPFKLSTNNLNNYTNHKAYSFWLNLQEGYNHFIRYKRPPNVNVLNGRYVFSAQ